MPEKTRLLHECVRPRQEAFAIWLAAVLAIAASVGLMLHASLARSQGQSDRQLRQIAQIAAHLVDPDAQERLGSDADTGNPDYLAQLDPLIRLQESLPALQSIYTLREAGGQLRIILDTQPWVPGLYSGDAEAGTRTMAAYAHPERIGLARLEKGEVSLSPSYAEGPSRLKSACAPVMDRQGQFAGAACVDAEIPSALAAGQGRLCLLPAALLLAAATALAALAYHWRRKTLALLQHAQRSHLHHQASLSAQKRKAEALLSGLMPQKIAQRMKAGEHDIADWHENASAMVVDIAFSPCGHDPKEALAFLNQLFSCFDQQVKVHGLDKIKALDGFYLVAGGLGQPGGKDASRMAQLALALRDEFAAFRRLPGFAGCEARIGIATGAAIAGIIGGKQPAYGLWGEAVENARRMAFFSEPGKIHCTPPFAQEAGKHFDFCPRGEIHIRDKGFVPTYFLEGEKA